MAATHLILVQHAEKLSAPGDPGLSVIGRSQARIVAELLRRTAARHLYASPARRAQETAVIIADVLALPVVTDDRLGERMNWNGGAQTHDEFLAEWMRTTRDRDYVPASGESSRSAGQRLKAFLEKLAPQHAGDAVIFVTHGGVTVDLARTLIGDEALQAMSPRALTDGVPACAITRLVHDGRALVLAAFAELQDHERLRRLGVR